MEMRATSERASRALPCFHGGHGRHADLMRQAAATTDVAAHACGLAWVALTWSSAVRSGILQACSDFGSGALGLVEGLADPGMQSHPSILPANCRRLCFMLCMLCASRCTHGRCRYDSEDPLMQMLLGRVGGYGGYGGRMVPAAAPARNMPCNQVGGWVSGWVGGWVGGVQVWLWLCGERRRRAR